MKKSILVIFSCIIMFSFCMSAFAANGVGRRTCRKCNDGTYEWSSNSSCSVVSGITSEENCNADYVENGVPSSKTLQNFCDVNKNPEVMRTFKIGGLALNILKIMIPILLIILGSVDLAQAVISNDEKQVSKSIMKLVQRVIAGVVIFLVPTLIEYVFNLVDSTATNRYKACYECLLDVSKCPEIPKIGG